MTNHFQLWDSETKKAHLKNSEELVKLEQFEKTRGKLRLPPDIKPCISNLLNGASPLARSGMRPFIIACELHRVGKEGKQITSILLTLGVAQSKVRGAVQSATKGKYSFGCPRLEELELCCYKNREQCWWHQKIPKKNQKPWRESDFWRFGWPQRLKPAQIVIYLAIKEIGKKRGLPAKSQLFISRQELASESGVSERWTMECCEGLKAEGLIEFKKGRQHKHYGQASRIKRVIPIPKPKRGIYE